LGNSARAALGSSAIAALSTQSKAKASTAAANKGGKTRVALVGTGSRGTATWGRNLLKQYSDCVEMVGLSDINYKRLAYAKKYLQTDAPTYDSHDFDKMIKETNPDMVIVTTTDCFHTDYAIRAMELGCDAFSEKPMATEVEQCQRLLEVEQRTGKKLLVGFNCRHMYNAMEIKKFIQSGKLGRIISVDFQEYLDIQHGASYFRRWHGKNRFSGSLLVHKACHQFDEMNWWLDAEPVEVNAFGKVAFYGKNNSFRWRNCRGCPFEKQCQFYFDLTKDKRMVELYLNCEDVDGYLRDSCVWDNAIDSYDSATVEVKYNNDVIMSYTLNAFMPYEGQRIAFNGQKGRLDIYRPHRQPWKVEPGAEFRFTENFGETNVWRVTPSASGEHGGSDKSIKDMVFRPGGADPLGQKAGVRDGVMSSIIGIAARKSIEMEQRIKISDLIKLPSKWSW